MRGLPRNQVLVGDARWRLDELPEGAVDMVLTSPPYFRLRDYGVAGQLGLEGEVAEWVVALRGIARQLQRVLVPSGSFWLNVADSYSVHAREGAGRKSLLLGPERLALGLLDDGWLLRNKIVWAKRNHLPSSVRDRLACGWEALYVFVREPSYFFDLDAIRQPHRSRPPRARARLPGPRRREAWRGPNGDDAAGLAAMKAQGRVGHPLGKNPGDVWRLAASNYRGDHHATFPVALAERAIRAGCPEARCAACRTPWRRPTLRALTPAGEDVASRGPLQPGCRCRAEREPGLMLDPFFGAGSSGLAAESLGRDWLGIELKPEFAALAEQRIRDARASPTSTPP